MFIFNCVDAFSLYYIVTDTKHIYLLFVSEEIFN